MKEDAPLAPAAPGRSWRSIRQEVAARAMSRRGRRRQRLGWLRMATVALLVAGLGTGLYQLTHAWATDRAAFAHAVRSEPVKDVVLLTDGVLTVDWVKRTLALPAGTRLMELELAGLRAKLTAHGQVRVAVLTRNFPDTLVVTLQERLPVARVRLAEAGSEPRLMTVARDGVVYPPWHYEQALLETLPWLAGLTVRKALDGTYAPIPGFAPVAELLSRAQLEAPWLYREWQTVSLEHLASRDEIVVRSREVPEIVFDRRQDFLAQLARLDLTLERREAAIRQQGREIRFKSVNLALGAQVPVELAPAPDARPAAPPPAAPPGLRRTFDLSSEPAPRTKGKRDL